MTILKKTQEEKTLKYVKKALKALNNEMDCSIPFAQYSVTYVSASAFLSTTGAIGGFLYGLYNQSLTACVVGGILTPLAVVSIIKALKYMGIGVECDYSTSADFTIRLNNPALLKQYTDKYKEIFRKKGELGFLDYICGYFEKKELYNKYTKVFTKELESSRKQ